MNYILGRPDDDDKKKRGGGTTATTTTGAQTGGQQTVIPLTPGAPDTYPQTMVDGNPTFAPEEVSTTTTTPKVTTATTQQPTTFDEAALEQANELIKKSNQRQEGQQTAKEAQEAKAATTKVGGSIDGLVQPESSPSSVAQAAEAKVSAATPSAIRDDVDKATQMKNYREVLNYLQGGVESKEAREKREKREARERKFAALSDALGAMHRAYTHSRGIEAMKLPQNAYEETLRRQQMLKQHRDQNAQAYATAYERMQQGKRAEEAAKLDKEYKERKLEFDRMNAESLRDYRLNQALNNDRRTSGYVSDKENQSKNRDYDTKSKDNLRRNQASNNNARTANQRAHNQVTEAQGWARLDQSNPENWETTSNSVQGFDMQTGGKTTTTKTTKSRKGSGGGGKNPNPMNGGGSKQNGGKGRKRNPMG